MALIAQFSFFGERIFDVDDSPCSANVRAAAKGISCYVIENVAGRSRVAASTWLWRRMSRNAQSSCRRLSSIAPLMRCFA